MTIRWYVMPSENVASPHGQLQRPQGLGEIVGFAADGRVLGSWGWMSFNDNWAVGWADLDATQHTTYNASAGVTFLTADLSATLTPGQVTAVQTRLSNRNFPSAWVDVSDTWAQVIDRVCAFMQCFQLFMGENTSPSISIGLPVTTLVSSLSQANQNRLDFVAANMASGGLPVVDHVNDTIESLLMRWSDVLVGRDLLINGIQL